MTIMANDGMRTQISTKDGFNRRPRPEAAGRRPAALRLYGIPDSAYSGRDRDVPGSCTRCAVAHHDGLCLHRHPDRRGHPVRSYDGRSGAWESRYPPFLWEDRGVVPFLKVDKGLEGEKRRRQPDEAPCRRLIHCLARAVKLGIFGTKMRSVINLPSKSGLSRQSQAQQVSRVGGHRSPRTG